MRNIVLAAVLLLLGSFQLAGQDVIVSGSADFKRLCEGNTLPKKEGWTDKSGSKWNTMPGQMLRYRAAAFWQRVYCPEIAMGLMTSEEYEDIDDQTGMSIRDEIKEKANKQTIEIPVPEAVAEKLRTKVSVFRNFGSLPL